MSTSRHTNKFISIKYILEKICNLESNCFKINNDLSIDLCLPPNTSRGMHTIHPNTIHQVLTLKALKKTHVNLIACRNIELAYYIRYNNIPKNLDCENVYIYYGTDSDRTHVTMPHLLNLDCYLDISSNNVYDFSGIQNDFSGCLYISHTKIQSLKTLPKKVKILTISYNHLNNLNFFQNIDLFQNMQEIKMSYITNDYIRYMPFHKKGIDYYGILNFLNCYSLEDIVCIDLESIRIIKKYIALYSNKQEYLMDCALELIQNGFPNGAEL